MKKTGIVCVAPNDKVNLKKIDPDQTGDYESKEEGREAQAKMVEQIVEWQEKLYAEDKRALLLVFQATDTGGKDGAIRHLLTGINPAGVRVASFKVPSTNELEHDFLWRIHQAAPARGMIGVWNRSHYEDVLVTRVHGIIDKKTWQKRYEHINAFEQMLTDAGTTILKFYLHISKDEQKERLQARLDNPDKLWKFSSGDLEERNYWDDYQKAFEDALQNCSTKAAPWFIVPANHKWARDVAIADCVLATLKKMKPEFPKATFDPKKQVID